VTDTYRYNAWGEVLSSTGSSTNRHTWIGRHRYCMTEGSFVALLGHRYYMPGIGRFTTRDPGASWPLVPMSSSLTRVRNSWHLGVRSPVPRSGVSVLYAWNRPAKLVDATGLSPWTCDQCLDLPWGLRHICWVECEPVIELPSGSGGGLVGGYFCSCEEQLDYWKKQADEELQGGLKACDFWEEDVSEAWCDSFCRGLIGEGPPNPGYRGCLFVCQHYAGAVEELCDAMVYYWYWSHIGYAEAEYLACKLRRREPWP